MRLTGAEIVALLPLIVLTGTTVVVMLLAAFARSRLAAGVTAGGLLAAIGTLAAAARVAPIDVTPLLRIDGAALFYTGLLLATALATALLSTVYFAARGERTRELEILLLTSTLGGAVLAAASHFAALFLGFELLTVSLFAMLAYEPARPVNLEAGIKYLVLSGVSSGFLLFGIALIYYALGTLKFTALAAAADASGSSAYLAAGLALLVGGLAFKLSLAPFHLWTPDVYQGAPAPVTAFLSTVSKGAVFVVLLRYFTAAGAYGHGPILVALTILAAASMLLGNVLALLQQNVKRLLAYSSIAHLGYLMTAFIAGGGAAVEAASYYLAAYFASTLGAFGVVAVLSSEPGASEEIETIEQYRGLFRRRPWVAAVFSLMLLSLAGIPLTMGFVAKFYVIEASVESSLWALLAIVIVGSAIGLYYYLRLLVTMYLRPDEAAAPPAETRVSIAGRLVLAGAAAAVLVLGLFPAPIIDLIRSAALTLL
ncbi:MAG TPA: NADH-quinone oxidoreductase subunit N [Gammaproteobacteria bacterium]|nr:NADH-quinone oxidoreductase subunit N [Gammaproteobacteria bacterium]